MKVKLLAGSPVYDPDEQVSGEEAFDMQPHEIDTMDAVVNTALFDSRVIWIDGEIDDYIARMVCKRITVFNIEDAVCDRKSRPIRQPKPICIFIRSNGGDSDCAFAIISAILTSSTEVRTVNVGPCDSAAGLIFMAGQQRFMMPYASVLIHDGSTAIDGPMHAILDVAESCKKWLEEMCTYISRRTHISKRALEQYARCEWRLGAQECLEYGVCTNIITNINEVFA